MLGDFVWPDRSADAGRTCSFDWAAWEVDGKTAMAFESDDKVRFKLAASVGGDPLLDLISGVPSDNDSEVTLVAQNGITAATGVVTLAKGDTSGLSGTYYGELILVDASEPPTKSDKPIGRGKIIFKASQGGTLGLP